MKHHDYDIDPLELVHDCEDFDKLFELAQRHPWMKPLVAAAQKKLQAELSRLEPEQTELL